MFREAFYRFFDLIHLIQYIYVLVHLKNEKNDNNFTSELTLFLSCKTQMKRIKINDKTLFVVNNEWVLTDPTEFIARQKNNNTSQK